MKGSVCELQFEPLLRGFSDDDNRGSVLPVLNGVLVLVLPERFGHHLPQAHRRLDHGP